MPVPMPLQSPEDTAASLTRAWEEAFNRGDAEAVAALYAPDARLFTPTRVIATGREAIRAYWRSLLDHGFSGQRFEPVQTGAEGSTLWQGGRWHTGAAGQGSPHDGNYLLVCRGEGAEARIAMHIWN